MSLQVWLPLNGSLENQGLSDLNFQVVNYNNAITSATTGGKVVSGLYKRTSRTADYIISNKNITLDGDITMCCWAKVTGISDSGTANGLFGQHGHNTGGLGITVKDVSSTDFRMSVNTGLYGDSHGSSSDRTFCSYYGTTNIYNTWHHLCLTYNNTTKQLRIYVDGKSERFTHNNSYILTLPGNNITPRPVILFAWSTDHLGSTIPWYRPPCELNDVRIYDHCLSPREVKLLAQGLRLHYKFSLPRITNIAQDVAYSIYNNYGSEITTSIIATGQSYMGYPIYRLSMTPTTTAAVNGLKTEIYSHGIYQSRFTFNASTKYCYWIYYKPVTHSDIVVGGVASNIGGWTELPPTKASNGWTRVGQYRNGSVTTNQSDNIYTSFYTPSAALNTTIQIDFCGGNLISGQILPIESYNAAIDVLSPEYDCSGYCQHAALGGKRPTSTAEYSWRYPYVLGFGTSAYFQVPTQSFAGMQDSYTFSWWSRNANMDNRMAWGFANGNNLNLYPASSQFNWNTGDGANNPFQLDGNNVAFAQYNVGEGHHYVITGDGTPTTLYIDGEKKGTALYYRPITGTQLIISGWNSSSDYKWNGHLSDFRLYATALSATEVRELYDSSISFLNNGTLQCGELVEADTNIKYNKNGIVQTQEINESNTNLKLFNNQIQTYQIYEL